MRDRLVELLQNFADGTVTGNGTIVDRTKVEDVADFLLANGVIVPPCKVGDVVYRVSFVHKKVEMLNVEGMLCNLASWKVHCTHFSPKWLGNQKEHIYISFSQFGKTAFLTYKEAEKALKGGAE